MESLQRTEKGQETTQHKEGTIKSKPCQILSEFQPYLDYTKKLHLYFIL